jgi:hypothetical protein
VNGRVRWLVGGRVGGWEGGWEGRRYIIFTCIFFFVRESICACTHRAHIEHT